MSLGTWERRGTLVQNRPKSQRSANHGSCPHAVSATATPDWVNYQIAPVRLPRDYLILVASDSPVESEARGKKMETVSGPLRKFLPGVSQCTRQITRKNSPSSIADLSSLLFPSLQNTLHSTFVNPHIVSPEATGDLATGLSSCGRTKATYSDGSPHGG